MSLRNKEYHVNNGLYKSSFYLLVIILLFLSLSGCFGRKASDTGRLYFEPPERVIDDYTGMIEREDVNWAWDELGFRFSNYQTITVKPVGLFVAVDDKGISEKIYKAMIAWFEDSVLQLSDEGELICESAIVELNLKRDFFTKWNPFDEDKNDLFLQLELVIKDASTQRILCKVRHGAVAAKVNSLLKQTISGLTGYFESLE